MVGIPVHLRAPRPEGEGRGHSLLAALLRRRRAKLGLCRAAAAAMMDVCEGTLRKWECGRHEPTVSAYPAIISFLGRDPWPKPTSLSEELRAARFRRGYTIPQAASELRIDASTYWSWEHGRRIHRHADRAAVDAFIGTHTNDLLASKSTPELTSDTDSNIILLGDLLRDRRRALGLSQVQAAANIGVNPWTLLGWEQSHHEPPDRFFPSIIKFLG